MSSINTKRPRSNTWLLSLVIAGLGVGCGTVPDYADETVAAPASGLVAATDVAPVPPPQTRSFPDVESAIRGIRDAATPDEAVAAYSAGLALDRDNVALQEAYIRRLVDLNAPQLAEPAARRLVGVSPASSLAWSVIAFSEAKRGNMVDALTDIALGARGSPDDPFVQRTAGELLAWYDNAPTRPTLAQGIASDLDTVRRNLSGQPTFSQAYAKADTFYKNAPRPAVAGQGAAGAPAGTAPGGEPALPAAPDQYAPPVASASVYAPPPVYAAPIAPPDYYAGGVYTEPAYVAGYAPAYVAAPYYYSGCEFGLSFGFAEPLLFLGGDWGWCGGGDWHRHWDGWGYGRGYVYGRGYGDSRGYGYRGYASGHGAYAGGFGAGRPHGTYLGSSEGINRAYSRGGLSSGGSAGYRGRGSLDGIGRAAPGGYSGYSGRGIASTPRYGAPGPSYRSAAPRYAPSRGSYSAPSRSYGSSQRSMPRYSSPGGGGGSFRGGGGSSHIGGGSHGGGGHHR